MQTWHCERKVYDNSNTIIECVLVSGNTRKVLTRDKVKSLLQSGNIIIDNLALSLDGKLISKESKINDYVEACKTLGIKPLYIERINDDYVITKVPNSTNVYIPKFVTYMRVNQPLNINSDGYLASYTQTQTRMDNVVQQGGAQGGLTLTALRPLFEKLFEMLGDNKTKLSEIITKLDTSGLSEEEKEDIRGLLQEVTLGVAEQPVQTAENIDVLVEPPDLSEITDKLDSIGTKEDDNNNFNTVTGQLNALDNILNDIRNNGTANAPDVEALRTLISENGQKLQDLKTQIIPMCTQLVDVYSRVSQQASENMQDLVGYNSASGIVGASRVLDRTTCVSPDNYIWDDEDKYNGYISANTNDYLLSYEQGELLAHDINIYFGEYAKINRVLKEFSEDENVAIGGFLEVVSPVTDTLNTLSGTVLAPLTSGATTVANHAVGLTEFISRKNNANRIRKLFKNVYEMPESLKEFYDISDEDVATYLMERNYYKKQYSKQNKEWKQLKFKYLLSLITEVYKREGINAFSVEEEVRVAVAYIAVKKAMCNLSPNFNVKFLSYTVCNDPNLQQDIINGKYPLGICEIRNKPLCMKVFRHLFKNALLIVGFKPSYLDKLLEVYDDVTKQNGSLSLDRQEWDNLEFNMDRN